MMMAANRVATVAVATAMACASALIAIVDAQTRTRSNPPSITGAWERIGPGALSATQGAGLRLPPAAQSSPPLKPQFLKEWQARQQAAREATAKGQPFGINWVKCLPDGMPGMMSGPFPMEVLQTPGQVTIIQESFTQVRRILLDRPQKGIDDVDPSFYGHSVGRWESDTLVVDTIGIKEPVQYQNVPHSDQMRIKERIHLVQPDLLWDEITVEDPVTLDKPWTFTFAYRRMPDYTLLEYICEDNREYIDEQGHQRMRLQSPPQNPR
jgi:hypothetical protein